MERMMQAAKHLHNPRLHRANAMGLDLSGMHLPKLSLLGEGPPAHLQDHLETLATPSGVLLEALHGKLLDTVLDLLPTTAERNDLSILLKGCFGVGCGCGGLVDDGLAHRQQIGPSHVDAGHGDLLALGINVRRLVDMRHLLAAEERGQPLGGGLFASDKALGAKLELRLSARIPTKKETPSAGVEETHNAGGRVDVARNGVDSDDMRRLLVPGTVFPPVVDGHLVPGVVEIVARREDLHGDRWVAMRAGGAAGEGFRRDGESTQRESAKVEVAAGGRRRQQGGKGRAGGAKQD